VLAVAIAGCATVGGRPVARAADQTREVADEIGVASFYASRFDGRSTASGERYDEHELTAAHRTLPFGTRVRVTRLESGRSVVLRINDRGPHLRGRVLDVSLAAARSLRFVQEGTTRVRVEVLGEEAAAR
jgi:rare lipoprotein A